jgi:Holliday junction DNA helicase RuvA
MSIAELLISIANKIKGIKGIGLKTAQRLILELKDKVVKGGGSDNSVLFSQTTNSSTEEAITALVLLGFTKANVNKAVSAVLKGNPTASLEDIIKLSLKLL